MLPIKICTLIAVIVLMALVAVVFFKVDRPVNITLPQNTAFYITDITIPVFGILLKQVGIILSTSESTVLPIVHLKQFFLKVIIQPSHSLQLWQML